MELKNILTKIGTSREEERETFLALEISSEAVKSAVWSVEENKTTILKTGSIEEWQEEDKASLINAVDVSISNASEGVEPEPDKIIFGLSESWVKGEEINKDKIEVLKTLCAKLDLKPLGFVVTLEALTVFLKKERGAPISAVFINLSETQSLISLVLLGKIIGTKVVGRSDDLAADVREGLARFGKLEDLPSQMILYNGVADFEEAKQELVSFDWLEQLPFLHFPKVEVLDVLTPVKAVAIAGGAEVAKSLGFEIKEEKTEDDPKKTAVELGFIQGKDVAEMPVEKIEEQPTPGLEKKTVGKVRKIKARKPFLKNPLKRLNKFFTFYKRLAFKLPKLSIKKGPVLIFLPIALLLILFLAVLAFYWYVPKASVVLYFEPKVLEKEIEVVVETAASQINKETKIIPGELRQIEIEVEKTKETTGDKLVGDKAKGKIVVYNKTDLAKTFPAKTVLIGSNKLTFLLDEEIKVASKSAKTTEEGEEIAYGKATASVTASSIGPESNLPSQSQFDFKEYSSGFFSARTEEGFSGGTSRQIKAVSKEDRENLLNGVTAELRTQAREKIKAEALSTEEILGEEVNLEIISQKFSASEEDETDSLSLNLKIKFKFLTYKKEDLNQLLFEKISDDIPSGFVFKPESLKIETSEVLLEESKAKVKIISKLNLIPELNIEEIKNNIKGRYPEVIKTYLESLPNFLQADINISPRLPAKLNTLPRLSKNIQVETKIKE